MTPRQLLDLIEMPLAMAKPTSPLLLYQAVHIADGYVTASTGAMAVRVDVRDAEPLAGIRGCANARRLSLALSTLDTGAELLTKQDGATLNLRSGGSRRAVPLLPAEDFPMPTEHAAELTTVEDPAALAAAIAFARPAIATDELRPMYSGLNAVAGGLGGSDGIRAHMVTGAAAAAGIADGLILPLVALDKLQKLATEAAGDKTRPLQAGKTTNRTGNTHGFVAQWHRWRLRFQLIAAQAVPLDRVVPLEHAALRFSLPRPLLRAACRHLDQLAAGKLAPGAMLLLQPGATPDAGTLTMELAAGLQVGETVVEQLSCTYGGPEWRCGVNPGLLADALDVLAGDVVTVSCVDAQHSPLLLTGDAADRRCVVMRMRM